MSQKLSQQQTQQLKQRAAPINYSTLSINDMGELEQRSALLDQRIVEGYGCIWGAENEHGEMFTRGCFAKSIADNGPGSNANFQLKIRDEHGRACALFDVIIEDEIGLYFKTKPLDDVQWANDLLVQLRSGTINNFSVGFKYIWDRVQWDENNDCMIILEARLFEISAVAIPSDMETYALRSAEAQDELIDEVEDFINTLPKNKQLECRKIIAKYKSLTDSAPPIEAPTVKEPIEKRGIDYKALTEAIKKTTLTN